jgi:hypothetical protein
MRCVIGVREVLSFTDAIMKKAADSFELRPSSFEEETLHIKIIGHLNHKNIICFCIKDFIKGAFKHKIP